MKENDLFMPRDQIFCVIMRLVSVFSVKVVFLGRRGWICGMIAMKRRKKTIRPVADSRSYLLSGSRGSLRGDVAVFDGSEIPQ